MHHYRQNRGFFSLDVKQLVTVKTKQAYCSQFTFNTHQPVGFKIQNATVATFPTPAHHLKYSAPLDSLRMVLEMF